MTLSSRQQRIVALFAQAERGSPIPTIREIGASVDLSSSSTVHNHLLKLEGAGWLERDAGHARGWRLAGERRKELADEDYVRWTLTGLPVSATNNDHVSLREAFFAGRGVAS